MRAPLGYLNVRALDEHGREYRTVEIDEERAPFIRRAFEQYATGDHSVVELLADATARGLTTIPTPQRPSGPVGRSTFFKILRNPYYIGLVPYKGVNHPGSHEPLIDLATWQRVQSILDVAKKARARKRIHDHYLKGSLFCGTCGSRLQLDLPTNKQGIQYAYFSCSGRRTRKTKCTRRAIPVAVAEQLVADCYARISINEAQYVGLAKKVVQAFDERFAARSDELAELAANRRRLEDESDKLLAAHFADAIDLTTLKRHQDRIRTGLADIDRRIENEHDQDQGPRRQINNALRLLIDCQLLYKSTDAHGKRLANQTFTNGIDINEDEEASLRLAEPFAVTTGQNTHVRGSTTSEIVEHRGFEPLTSSMPWKRATNCANAPRTRPLYTTLRG